MNKFIHLEDETHSYTVRADQVISYFQWFDGMLTVRLITGQSFNVMDPDCTNVDALNDGLGFGQ